MKKTAKKVIKFSKKISNKVFSKNDKIAGRTVLLVSTGSIKKKFILQRLKKSGVRLVVLGEKESWAEPYVDRWILADNAKHSEALRAVREFIKNNPDEKIEGALTFWEDDVLLTSKIVDKFGFIGIPYAVSSGVRNKQLFRDFCEENEIAAPHHRAIDSEKDLDFVRDNFSFPVVIKPTFGSSSAFVIKVEDAGELESKFEYVKTSISEQVESAFSDGKQIMVEEYIDGSEVDVDLLVQNGIIKFFSISDNSATHEPFFIETYRLTPSNLPDDDQEDIIAMVEETLEKAGVCDGCIHFEAKVTRRGVVPIEANLRMGGDEMYSSVKKVWGVDLIEGAVKIAMGVYVPKMKIEEAKEYVLAKTFLSDHSGVVVQLDIDPGINKKDFVEEVKFFKKVGDTVMAPPEGYEYLGWMTVSGDNSSEAEENMEEAEKLIEYEVARFHSASSIGKTLRKDHRSSSILKTEAAKRVEKIEKIQKMSVKDQRNLHIGIACNLYDKNEDETLEKELTTIGVNIQNALKERGYRISFFDFNDVGKAFNDLKNSDVDLVFNVCERINNSSLLEPHVASLLDVLEIPYTGSNPFTLSLCIDKIRVKKLLNYHKIPTPEWDYVYSLEDKVRENLKYPLIVKPANTDNSIGITNNSVVTNKEQLKGQLEYVVKEMGRPALIEEYIEGDEYDVSIIGSEEDDLRVLPLSRSVFDKMPEGYWHIYPFESKYGEEEVYKKYISVQRPPKNISKKLEAVISEIALDTYNILDCHDYGRVEIRVDKNGNPYVLELNPNPTINLTSCVPSVAKLTGMDYGDFLEEVIHMAIKRYKNRPPYYHLQANLL
ncbi:MAG: ATP-grasp domain-containing protein [Candidatus Pacebacteria bacterium]|nr:ATP-grasp domain-containing protein [Candidatus Paceibacterota bacterium]